MKRLVLLLILLVAPAAYGQTAYTFNSTANQDTVLDRARVRFNATVCVACGLPTSCTKAEAVAANATVGADYSNTIQAFLNKRFKDVIQSEKAVNDAQDTTTFAQALATAVQATKDKLCADLSLAAGCLP